MEKFDKNYIIGFVLLFLMYGTYMYFYSAETSQLDPQTTSIDSTANTKPAQAITSQANINTTSIVADSIKTTEKLIDIENEDIIVKFSTVGASIRKVTLKNYKTYDAFEKGNKDPMVLFDADKSEIGLSLQTTTGTLNVNSLGFVSNNASEKIAGEKSSTISFETTLPGGGKLMKSYTIKGKGFEISESYDLKNAGTVILKNPAKLTWEHHLYILENDLNENRKSAQINYYDKEENFEDIGLGSVGNDEETAELPVKWFSFKQKYFTSGLISENSFFENTKFQLNTPTEADNNTVKNGIITATVPYESIASGKPTFKYFFGPNDLNILEPIAPGFKQNLYLGWDIVKPINRYVFVPLFNWVESFIGNYGLLIMLVVLIIKVTLTPLIYKSYVSSAKMRLLSPEINAIKEKVGDDSVKVQQETMKLYQQVGVSPLSGCVPLVLQMPILMSVFYLFPNMLMFRQKSFLWANDLSTFDAPISWGTSIPIIGNHISLFVVLMTLSSLAFTYYNNQITPDQPGPIDMKKISYVFPLVFFFVLNSFPAALSFYYLVSNLVTIAQQLIVRKFIDEDKIRGILDSNRIAYQTKPKKKNKFGDFLQKQLQASEEMKRKSDDLKKTNKKK